MKPSPGYERKLAEIASRKSRLNVPRDMWDERDWRAQREHEKEQRDRRARLIADMDRPAFIPATLAVAAGFSLHDRSADEARQRRLRANAALVKAGVHPQPWS